MKTTLCGCLCDELHGFLSLSLQSQLSQALNGLSDRAKEAKYSGAAAQHGPADPGIGSKNKAESKVILAKMLTVYLGLGVGCFCLIFYFYVS